MRRRSKTPAVVVSERLLLGLLGEPLTISRVSIDERISRIDRSWTCGCRASTDLVAGDTASWLACRRHEAMFLASADTGDDVGAWERMRSLVNHPQVRLWGAPALGVGIAVVSKVIYEVKFLLRRAEKAEGATIVDALTGLYNRRGWERRIEEERKRLKREDNRIVAVFVIDVDELRAINELGGFIAGDATLERVAKVIREVTREYDIAARVGGDEFAILTVQSQAPEADLIRARLERGFHSAALAVSIGFAFATSVDTIGEAMERAHAVMSEAKLNKAAHAVRKR